MKVYILKSVNPEEKPQEATGVSIYSTKELATDAFEKEGTEWNEGLDADTDSDYFVNVPELVNELRTEGFVEIMSGYHILDEYEVDSNQTI